MLGRYQTRAHLLLWLCLCVLLCQCNRQQNPTYASIEVKRHFQHAVNMDLYKTYRNYAVVHQDVLKLPDLDQIRIDRDSQEFYLLFNMQKPLTATIVNDASLTGGNTNDWTPSQYQLAQDMLKRLTSLGVSQVVQSNGCISVYIHPNIRIIYLEDPVFEPGFDRDAFNGEDGRGDIWRKLDRGVYFATERR